MKPENTLPSSSPEIMPSLPRPNVEYLNNNIAESGIEKSAEKVEQTSELKAVISDVAIPTTQVITDENSYSEDNDVANATDVSQYPITAKDEDLIEKEWIDKAKKIVDETTGDPYLREEAVNKLQADYLNKRYNRDVELSE